MYKATHVTSIEDFDIRRPLELWYAEKLYYDYSSDHCSGVCGHYTQVNPICKHSIHGPSRIFLNLIYCIEFIFPKSLTIIADLLGYFLRAGSSPNLHIVQDGSVILILMSSIQRTCCGPSLQPVQSFQLYILTCLIM